MPVPVKYIPQPGDYFTFNSDSSKDDQVFLCVVVYWPWIESPKNACGKLHAINLRNSNLTWFNLEKSQTTFIKLKPVAMENGNLHFHIISGT